MDYQLRHPYPSVQQGEEITYGGRQEWLSEATARRAGCGLVAAADLLLYLWRTGRGEFSLFQKLPPDPLPAKLYDYCAMLLCRRYFPLAASFGLNAYLLSFGMARALGEGKVTGLHPRWGTFHHRLWEDVAGMLERDLPVILCVGINFPLPWGKAELPLYAGEERRPAGAARAHYAAVTGMDGRWLRVSSWGREFFIERQELEGYRREHSCGLYTNILRL